MWKKIKPLVFSQGIVILLVVFFVLLSGSVPANGEKEPAAAGGVLDLQQWSFDKDGPVGLRGKWEFYWCRFLDPEKLTTEAKPELTAYVDVPGIWNNSIPGRKLPADGFATYRLKVILNKESIGKPVGFRATYISSAFRLFVNGHEVMNAGDPGTDRISSHPSKRIRNASYTPESRDMDIVVLVSNYHLQNGGFKRPIIIGTESDILRIMKRSTGIDMLIFGAMLIFGVYHLILYFQRRSDLSYLYFALLCLSICIRILFTNERYIYNIFTDIPWELFNKIDYLAVQVSIIFLLLFTLKIFSFDLSKWFAVVLAVLNVCIFFTILILPTHIFLAAGFMYFAYSVILIMIGYIVYLSIKALRLKTDGSIIYLAGYLVFAITAISDVTYNIGFVKAANLLSAGLLFMVISQSVILTRRFSTAFSSVEKLSKELLSANQALEYSVQFLDSMFNTITSTIISVDENSRINKWNAAAEILTGISETQAVSKNIYECVPFLKAYEQQLNDALSNGKQSVLLREAIPGKEKKYFNIAFCPLKFSTRFGAVIVVEDITSLEKKDEQLRQAQKMEAIGHLAGGVAHDFNNLLTPILGHAELMAMDSLTNESCRERAGHIIKAAEKARTMTMKLLTLSRKQVYVLKPVNLCNIVSGFENILRRTIRENIRIHVNIPGEPVMIMADAGLIEQVIMNMAVNAQDAITDSGILSIELALESLDKSFAMHHVNLKPGEYAVLTFSDSGTGMDCETIEHIFEPFFTTKESGKGTGLGLSTVFGIIEKHAGAIKVYSEKGKGATFRIYIPTTDSIDAPQENKLEESLMVGGKETILLVEDNLEVLHYTQEFLSSIGYNVIALPGPRECLDYAVKSGEKIHLLLTDVIMPDMSGKELFEKLVARLPDLKCIFMSGYSSNIIARHGLLGDGVNFIQKPFNIKDLAKKIKEILKSGTD
jgi:PAS domain S-box-containing protein